MPRQSKPVRLPGDDEAKLEGFAASMAAHQGIPFHKAKEKMVEAYNRSARVATKGGKGVDVRKFQDEMDKYIKGNAIPR